MNFNAFLDEMLNVSGVRIQHMTYKADITWVWKAEAGKIPRMAPHVSGT